MDELHIKKAIHPRNHEHLVGLFEFVQDFFDARPSLRCCPKPSDARTFCCDTQPKIYIDAVDRPIGPLLGAGYLSATRQLKVHPDYLLPMVIIEFVEWPDSHSRAPSELRGYRAVELRRRRTLSFRRRHTWS